MIKEARWSGWVWVGECFFWYRPTWVVPDQRPLNGRCCCCCCCCRQLADFGFMFNLLLQIKPGITKRKPSGLLEQLFACQILLITPNRHCNYSTVQKWKNHIQDVSVEWGRGWPVQFAKMTLKLQFSKNYYVYKIHSKTWSFHHKYKQKI